MSAQVYYQGGPQPQPQPQFPQQSYYAQPQYGAPPPQQQMYYGPPQGQQGQYQQAPAPRQKKDRGCLGAWRDASAVLIAASALRTAVKHGSAANVRYGPRLRLRG
ncbi:hypothetical protein EJ02DRAFT_467499 [Clathrospora elynae]|uniref:Cysteine-rich transmembrane CYSTM domain-containing protein n=1 Tax=Clathrospora elynae TaxID=706981 RepID=A0A6A5SHX8_9PLEO|nr:hypothetical protein EJ02DRAFT_467499 [Clathrospora elynae]